MTTEVYPEIQTATQALEQRISITQGEITQMKESIAAKETLIRGWRTVQVSLLPPIERAKADSTPQSNVSPFFPF